MYTFNTKYLTIIKYLNIFTDVLDITAKEQLGSSRSKIRLVVMAFLLNITPLKVKVPPSYEIGGWSMLPNMWGECGVILSQSFILALLTPKDLAEGYPNTITILR